jgi:hypothetical protein
VLLDLAPQSFGQPREPPCIAFRIQPSGGVSQLVCRQELQVVATGGDKRVDKLVAVVWRAVHRVAGFAHRVEQSDGARRGI